MSRDPRQAGGGWEGVVLPQWSCWEEAVGDPDAQVPGAAGVGLTALPGSDRGTTPLSSCVPTQL